MYCPSLNIIGNAFGKLDVKDHMKSMKVSVSSKYSSQLMYLASVKMSLVFSQAGHCDLLYMV